MKVGINNKVTLYFEDDDEEEVYTLVTTVRGISLKGWISTESPIGKAILGHEVGDRVYVEINANAGYYVEIRAIENTEDDGSIGIAENFNKNKSNAQISCALDLFFYRQRF